MNRITLIELRNKLPEITRRFNRKYKFYILNCSGLDNGPALVCEEHGTNNGWGNLMEIFRVDNAGHIFNPRAKNKLGKLGATELVFDMDEIEEKLTQLTKGD